MGGALDRALLLEGEEPVLELTDPHHDRVEVEPLLGGQAVEQLGAGHGSLLPGPEGLGVHDALAGRRRPAVDGEDGVDRPIRHGRFRRLVDAR